MYSVYSEVNEKAVLSQGKASDAAVNFDASHMPTSPTLVSYYSYRVL